MRSIKQPFKPALILLFAVAAFAAGCGGGGGGGGSVPSVPVTPTAAPQTQSTLQPVSIPNSGGPIPMPTVAGYAPTLTVPPGTTASAQAQTFTVLPAGIPALSIGRHTESFSGNLFLILAITTTAPVTFSSPPSIAIALPAGFPVAGVQFQLALFAPGATAWQENLGAGAYNASSNTVTYAGGSGAFTLPTGITYLAFYTIPAPLPSPSTAPTSSPTTAPTATPTPMVSPSSVSFTATGSANAQSVNVTEAGYTGAFTPGTNCSATATISVGANANQFIVTPVAPGTCTATFADSKNNTAPLAITVTTTSVGGN
ncbi:MAG: hypothetical protein ABR584_09220 [Candidatus Baltobacteraceae bacterium]